MVRVVGAVRVSLGTGRGRRKPGSPVSGEPLLSLPQPVCKQQGFGMHLGLVSQHHEVLPQFLGGFTLQEAICWLKLFQAKQEIAWSLSRGTSGLVKPHPGRVEQ